MTQIQLIERSVWVPSIEHALGVLHHFVRCGHAFTTGDSDDYFDIKVGRPNREFLGPYAGWSISLCDHAATRGRLETIASDLEHPKRPQHVKITPLTAWNQLDIRASVAAHNVPYNAMNDRGFLSVECIQCARAIQPGKHLRDGQWAGSEKITCGIRATADASSVVP